jgi:hypothetical protein
MPLPLRTYLSRSVVCGLADMTVRYETTTIGKLPRGTVNSRALSFCCDAPAIRPASNRTWQSLRSNHTEVLLLGHSISSLCQK